MAKAQQIHGSNRSHRIGEPLEARTKDALWFLARQWQTGEFEAESGGRPAELAIHSRSWAFDRIALGAAPEKPLDRRAPLEASVEAEAANGSSPAWRSEALEYRFGLGAGGHRFAAGSYGGRMLDWFHFDYQGGPAAGGPVATPPTQVRRMTPTQLYFRGAPHPRWWRIEEGDAYFDSPADPEPNALSLLLPEFFYVDIDNWYVAPLPMDSGSVHEIVTVELVDSFGVVEQVPCATGDNGNDQFALFGIDAAPGGSAALDGRFLFVPNVAAYLLDNDVLEEVHLMRDEQANLVWAWEHRIVDAASGTSVATSSEAPAGARTPSGPAMLRYVLKSPVARSWIPYVPRFGAAASALSGETYLRRGRTDETATAANPQYRSRLVAEAPILHEEEVPPTGLRVRRVKRAARGSDGAAHFWTARDKQPGERTARPNLRFDYVT
jgi:hypothetical protein